MEQITTLLERLPPEFRGRIDAAKAQMILLFGAEGGEHMTSGEKIIWSTLGLILLVIVFSHQEESSSSGTSTRKKHVNLKPTEKPRANIGTDKLGRDDDPDY